MACDRQQVCLCCDLDRGDEVTDGFADRHDLEGRSQVARVHRHGRQPVSRMILVIAKQHFVQIVRIDGPAEYLS